ncbi:MAG: VOC family protein, partial [Gammaproteobacteria bacterium]|nr:VOC family protein [Gammaproteobacteria bacterium]NIR63066.1 VOC family protein [candidate division Zixibacteria bacterium]NIT56104.1 VOC family protein [Fodinibius sp.]NIR94915.1 VOC family protein [Gammaproteobacteria bacterium]NIS45076.1 VOC family protein [candidate division Zixibacteria bacterium]
KNIIRSVEFYEKILGGKVLMDSGPGIVKVANTWIIVNIGGGPTEDKPDYTLVAPDPGNNRVNSFLNIRVADIHACYKEWKEKGAEFLTEPMDRGNEIRCYMKDPDGYIIEVGEATG